jgi:hypothetical protein
MNAKILHDVGEAIGKVAERFDALTKRRRSDAKGPLPGPTGIKKVTGKEREAGFERLAAEMRKHEPEKDPSDRGMTEGLRRTIQEMREFEEKEKSSRRRDK